MIMFGTIGCVSVQLEYKTFKCKENFSLRSGQFACFLCWEETGYLATNVLNTTVFLE